MIPTFYGPHQETQLATDDDNNNSNSWEFKRDKRKPAKHSASSQRAEPADWPHSGAEAQSHNSKLVTGCSWRVSLHTGTTLRTGGQPILKINKLTISHNDGFLSHSRKLSLWYLKVNLMLKQWQSFQGRTTISMWQVVVKSFYKFQRPSSFQIIWSPPDLIYTRIKSHNSGETFHLANQLIKSATTWSWMLRCSFFLTVVPPKSNDKWQ